MEQSGIKVQKRQAIPRQPSAGRKFEFEELHQALIAEHSR
jgi:hypothetical protein